jgi:cobalt-precorrin 5A hydrolase/precorrin-3B C17-methyltransferase
LAIEAIAGLATADRKADEPALLDLCHDYDWPLRTYKAEQLAVIPVPTPSEAVHLEMGTASVAEAAALLTAGGSGTLRQSKRIHHAHESEQGAVTIAIAESAVPMAPHRGELHLIGSGPGDPALMSGDATSALRTLHCLGWDTSCISICWNPYDGQIKFDSMGNSPRSGIDVRKHSNWQAKEQKLL